MKRGGPSEPGPCLGGWTAWSGQAASHSSVPECRMCGAYARVWGFRQGLILRGRVQCELCRNSWLEMSRRPLEVA